MVDTINIGKQKSNIYARSLKRNKVGYQTLFPARFDKWDEDDRILDEIELYINLHIEQVRHSLILLKATFALN